MPWCLGSNLASITYLFPREFQPPSTAAVAIPGSQHLHGTESATFEHYRCDTISYRVALALGSHFLPFTLDFPTMVAHTYSSKTLGLKQEDPTFEASLGYIDSCLKQNQTEGLGLFLQTSPRDSGVFSEGDGDGCRYHSDTGTEGREFGAQITSGRGWGGGTGPSLGTQTKTQ